MSRQNLYESTHQPMYSSSFPQFYSNGMGTSNSVLRQRAPENNQAMQQSFLSKDTDLVDESMLISNSSFNVHDHTHRQPHLGMPPKYHTNREYFHLPSINHSQQKPKIYRYVQSNIDPIYESRPQPVRYRSLNHYRSRQYRHGETYDSRWWYMPINSVHGPKSRQLWTNHHHHHYSPPKWYELPDRR